MERHVIVLHICALHYDSDMIYMYISSPQPYRKSSYHLGQVNGDTLGHTFRVCEAMIFTLSTSTAECNDVMKFEAT